MRTVHDEDPRFRKPKDSFDTEALKLATAADISLGIYLCSSLMDQFYSAPEKPDGLRRKIMSKILENLSEGYLKLQSAVTVARSLYSKEEFDENVMCTTGDAVLKQYAELADFAKTEKSASNTKKMGLLKYKDADSERDVFHCVSCRKPMAAGLKFCGVCGFKVPKNIKPTPKDQILPDGSLSPTQIKAS